MTTKVEIDSECLGDLVLSVLIADYHILKDCIEIDSEKGKDVSERRRYIRVLKSAIKYYGGEV